MDVRDAIKEMLNESRASMRSVSLGMGKSESFLYVTLTKNSVPQADTLAAIAAQCGYTLALIPNGETLPASAIVID